MADETPAPLSDAEIDAIRARIDAWLAVAEPRDGGEVDMRLPVLGLLATLTARDAELAALRSEAKAAEIDSDSAQNLIAKSVDNCERLEQEIEALERENAAYREVRGQALADNARLAGERDAMREIVAAVADMDPMWLDGSENELCVFMCGAYDGGAHTATCPVTRARALLATPPAHPPAD